MNGHYSVASGSIDITPQVPIALAGYSSLRTAAFEGVSDPLEANVVILRGGDVIVVFVAFDLMYVGAYLRDEIFKALAGRVPREAILTTAVHTHFGPPTEDSLPILGKVTPEYRSYVAQRVSELTLRLLAGPFAQVSLEYHEGAASHSVNRRRRVFGFGRRFPFLGRQVRIEPNPSGQRDDTIHVIRVRNSDGDDVAVCWAYACHPVSFPLLNDLSAEYPGVVRNMIRASFGDIPVVFWQGFSGNTGPLQAMRAPDRRTLPVSFRAPTLNDWYQWARSLGQCVSDAARGQGAPIGGPIAFSVRTLPLHELGLSSEKQLHLHEIRFGRDLIICGLNAEVAVEYVEILKELHAPASVIPVGCVGDVFGYLPVDAMVREGGYEAAGFLRRFGLGGRFLPNISAIVTERLLRCPRETKTSETQTGAPDQRGAGVVEGGGNRSTPTGSINV